MRSLSFLITTPSYNQASFVYATARSVVEQLKEGDRYVIRDACSSDGTDRELERVRKLSRSTTILVERDNGQSDAINRSFRDCEEDILYYINSDDVLAPESLEFVRSVFSRNPNVDIITGARRVISSSGRALVTLPPFPYPTFEDYLKISLFYQEATFWRSSIYSAAGGYVDDSLKFAVDYDLFLRMMRKGARVMVAPRVLGHFRTHRASKTSNMHKDVGFSEMNRVRSRVGGMCASIEEQRDMYRNVVTRQFGLGRSLVYRAKCSILRRIT